MNNKFLQTFLGTYPLRKRLLRMLRPMDIVAIRKATGLQLTGMETNRYMVWWRQLFLDMKWADRLTLYHCTVTLIGNDLGRLNEAIRSMDYTFDASHLKILVVIREPNRVQRRVYGNNHDILPAFDALTAWHEVPHPSPIIAGLTCTSGLIPAFKIKQPLDDIQICVVSIMEPGHADLNPSWSKVLSSDSEYKTLDCYSDLWRTEWQVINNNAKSCKYAPTYMHYLIYPPDIEKCTPRLFTSPNGPGVELALIDGFEMRLI